MAISLVNNGDSGLVARTKINEGLSQLNTANGLIAGTVPLIDNSGDFAASGANVNLTTNVWTFDQPIVVPEGSISFGETITLSEGVSNLILVDELNDINNYIPKAAFDDTGTSNPTFLKLGAEFVLNIQTVDTTNISTNPLNFSLTGTVVAPDQRQFNTVTFRTFAAMTNVRIKITDNATSTVIRYLPDKASWDAGTGGFDFINGDNLIDLISKAADSPGVINLGVTPILIKDGQVVDFSIEADAVSVKGNATSIPYLVSDVQDGPESSLLDANGTLADNAVILGNGLGTIKSSTRLSVVDNEIIFKEAVVDETLTLFFKDTLDATLANLNFSSPGGITFATVDEAIEIDAGGGTNALILSAAGDISFQPGTFVDITAVTGESQKLLQLSRTGGQNGGTDLYVSNRTPVGNVSAEPASISVQESAATSDIWFHRGSGSDNTSWQAIFATLDATTPDTTTLDAIAAYDNTTGQLGERATITATSDTITSLGIGTTSSTGTSSLLFQDDTSTQTADISYDHALGTLGVTSTTDVSFVSQTGSTSISSTTFNDFVSTGALAQSTMRFSRSGVDGGTSEWYIQGITPIGNTTGNPGDLAIYVDGNNSDLFVHKGASADNTTWAAMTGGDPLSVTLIAGNTTGGTDIVISVGDSLVNAIGHTGTAINLNTDNDTGTIVNVQAPLLTTGTLANFSTNSSSASSRQVVKIEDTSTLATGSTGLHLTMGAANSTAINIVGGNIGHLTNTTNGTAYSMVLDDATTGIGLSIVGDDLTTGALATFDSNSVSASGRSLVEINQNNAAASDAVGLTIFQTSSATALDIQQTGVGRALNINAATTDNIAIDVSLDSLTSGDGIQIRSDSTDSQNRVLVDIINGNAAATGALAFRVLQQANAIAAAIDGECTTATVMTVDGNDLTTGEIARFSSSSADTNARTLVSIDNTNAAATGATTLFLNQAANATTLDMNGNGVTTGLGAVLNCSSLTTGTAFQVNSNSSSTGVRDIVEFSNIDSGATSATVLRLTQNADHEALIIDGTGVTTDFAAEITVDNATLGGALDISSNSISSSTRQLVKITNDNTAATGTIPLQIQQDAAATALDIQQNAGADGLNIFSTATAGDLLHVESNTIVSGSLANFYSNSTDTAVRNLVIITNDNSLAQNTRCLAIVQDGNEFAMRVVCNGITTTRALDIDCNSVTSGGVARFSSNSADAGVRELVTITNDNVGATGARVLSLTQDADNVAFEIVSAGIAMDIFGGLIYVPTDINGTTHSITSADSMLYVYHTATAAVTVTIPSLQADNGRRIVIKDTGGNSGTNNITVDTGGAETIDGETNLVISVDYKSVTLVSDGTDWFII